MQGYVFSANSVPAIVVTTEVISSLSLRSSLSVAKFIFSGWQLRDGCVAFCDGN